MADLIDRAVTIALFMPRVHNADDIEAETVVQYIKDIPAVDAVEVVRCKDCLRRYSVMCPMRFFDYEDGEYADYTKHNYFCSSGERKTNDD